MYMYAIKIHKIVIHVFIVEYNFFHSSLTFPAVFNDECSCPVDKTLGALWRCWDPIMSFAYDV